ncbi:MAG: hypothetical protein QOG01_2150 [Pseudonocardiales bacterium]|jgi:GNAT superfamily N-acetyltransferase|nr:hypothetical protein [Pseudonocardiales bacterium]
MPDPSEVARQGRSGWWHCVVIGTDDRPSDFAVVWSDRHADGTRLELGAGDAQREIGEDAVCVATYGDEGRVTRLQVKPRGAPKAPPVWFAEIRESTAQPPAVSLIVFSGFGVLAGALVDQADLGNLPVSTDDQMGAVRWYPATGEVDQIYVQPAWRRRTLAGALIAAASTLSLARGWSRLWSDGQRTDLGEALRNNSPWRPRAADRTHVAPPMTPGPA